MGLIPQGYTLIIGLVVVIGFCVWKFLVQPIINEGEPIEPKEEKESSVFAPVDF